MPKKIAILISSVLVAIGLVFTNPFAIYGDSDVFDSSNYTLVDYVSPNGDSSYIDTGYLPKSTTSIISTFSYTAITSGRRFYGANDSSNQYGLGISSSNYYVVRYTSGSTTKNTDGKFGVNTLVTFNQSPSVTTATDGTTTYTTATYSQSNNITKSLYIFSSNTTSGSQNQYSSARLYNMEVYESSVLVHHYYPCFRKSDNVVGLYDGIDSVFISPSNGSLSYGSIATTQYTITTSVSPSGSGSVTGGGTYDSGSVITLTATPNNGYVFSSWSDGSTINPLTINVSGNISITAYFEEDSSPGTTQYTISTSVSPSGSGSVTGGGTYDSGSVITLTATPNNGYVFSSWSDGSTINPRSIQVTSNASYTAFFTSSSPGPSPSPSDVVLGFNVYGIGAMSTGSYQVVQWSQDPTNPNRYIFNASQYSSTMQNYYYTEVDGILNDDYVGEITIGITYDGTTYNRVVYVNGNMFKIIVEQNSRYTMTLNVVSTSNLFLKESLSDVLYNGTTESQETNNSFNEGNEELNESLNDIYDLENDFNDNMNDSLDDIDTSFDFDTGFGSKFLASANFVKDQFDFMTQNNAFGSLLSFSLLLGLGLLIIGKIL